jgi:hypothetical protein
VSRGTYERSEFVTVRTSLSWCTTLTRSLIYCIKWEDKTVINSTHKGEVKMATRNLANNYIKLLKELADHKLLNRVYLFGSLTKQSVGNDVDIIIEVPEEVFLEFATNCIGCLDGFHPIEKIMMPSSSMYWDYNSSSDARITNAVQAIGITSEASINALNECSGNQEIDILCLPSRWKEDEYAGKLLEDNFGKIGKDPNIFQKIKDSAIEM